MTGELIVDLATAATRHPRWYEYGRPTTPVKAGHWPPDHVVIFGEQHLRLICSPLAKNITTRVLRIYRQGHRLRLPI
jgi:hypothetical protein